jgi:CubicO group peptidase (beta-lactamase class C family)
MVAMTAAAKPRLQAKSAQGVLEVVAKVVEDHDGKTHIRVQKVVLSAISHPLNARAHMTLRIACVVACSLALPGIGFAQDHALSRIDSVVKAEMARQKIPGVGVAIIKGGEVMLAKGYGEANVEHHVPVTPETVFESGSVGKQFTSTAVMLLVQDGKIALTDPITKYFPNAPASWKGITVRHLLTHTSGIPDYTTDAMDYRKDYTEDDIEKIAFGLKPEFHARVAMELQQHGLRAAGNHHPQGVRKVLRRRVARACVPAARD